VTVGGSRPAGRPPSGRAPHDRRPRPGAPGSRSRRRSRRARRLRQVRGRRDRRRPGGLKEGADETLLRRREGAQGTGRQGWAAPRRAARARRSLPGIAKKPRPSRRGVRRLPSLGSPEDQARSRLCCPVRGCARRVSLRLALPVYHRRDRERLPERGLGGQPGHEPVAPAAQADAGDDEGQRGLSSAQRQDELALLGASGPAGIMPPDVVRMALSRSC
jgi:hypothetical protein